MTNCETGPSPELRAAREIEQALRGARRAAFPRPADLSLDLRARRHRLRRDDRPQPGAARPARRRRSRSPRPSSRRARRPTDGTTKFLLRLDDGRHIEAVYIPDTPAQTFCISTQVGCAMGCAFCLTGKMGLVRNLTAGEIAGQVRVLAHETGLAGTAFNIVLMGMGEPLHNYDATMKALRILGGRAGTGACTRAGSRCRRSASLPALERLAQRAADAEPRDLAARDDRRATRRGSCRSIASTTSKNLIDACKRFPLAQAPPDHVRVRAARWRQRHARRRAAAGQAARRASRPR